MEERAFKGRGATKRVTRNDILEIEGEQVEFMHMYTAFRLKWFVKGVSKRTILSWLKQSCGGTEVALWIFLYQ